MITALSETIGVWEQGVLETLVVYTGFAVADRAAGVWRTDARCSARSPSPPAHPSPTLAQRPPDVAGSRGNLQNPFTDTHMIHTHLQAFTRLMMAQPQHRRGGDDPAPPRSTAYHNLAETSHFTFPPQGTVKTHHP
ncbi:unnamed protein product [Danaus chrysippus]|uniref:(African queen) hypothetical protein n=1 Tax=Danaus chrysippus TaxID=151541 RepID=A0A8J2R6B8_9NEOP|nr:unnamed protein product [Danaus chrysippus]